MTGPDLVRYRRGSGTLWRRSGDRVLLRTATAGPVTTLSETGATVWMLLRDGGTVAELVDQLSKEYHAPAELITADVQVLLRGLVDRRLVDTEP